MKAKSSLLWLAGLLFLVAAGIVGPDASSAAPTGIYQISWSSTGAGTTRLASTSYNLTGAASPVDASGPAVSTSYRLVANYLSIGGYPASTAKTYLPMVVR